MRVALIVPGGVDRSGEYRVIPALLALIQRLARSHDVQVFALSQCSEVQSWQLCGATIHSVGKSRTRLAGVAAVLRHHRREPFDVLHAIWSGSCGMTAVAAAKLLRRPSLVHVAGGELVALPDIGYGGMRSFPGRVRERTVLRTATCVTAASALTLSKLQELGVQALRVPLGVDLDAWPARAPVRRSPGRPAALLHIASLNRVKDQGTLLRALSELMRLGVEFQLDVIGEDTLNGEIQRTAARLKLQDRVRFWGFLTQRQLRPRVALADLLVHSSRHETGPVAMLEAALLGVPTVGTAVGHIAEWSPHASAAVPVGDWQALAYQISDLLGDEERRLEMGRRAMQLAIQEDADHTAARFETLYAAVA